MNNTAVRVEHLSKRYRIGARQGSCKTLRESLVGTVAAPLRRLRLSHVGEQPSVNGQDTIWPLKNREEGE